MSTPDVFAASAATGAFSMRTLTAVINHVESIPGRLGELGLFEEKGVPTTQIALERKGDSVAIVPTAPRGAPVAPRPARGRRDLIPLIIPHLPARDKLLADEVSGVRAFGSETLMMTVLQARDEKIAAMARDLSVTHEYHRIGAIKGQVLDADGSLILDLFETFGVSQQRIPMALNVATTEAKERSLAVKRAIKAALGAERIPGVRVFCGPEYWAKWIVLPTVKEAYLGWAAATQMSTDPLESFGFGGITWELYDEGDAYIPDDEAYAVPESVPGLFVSRYAPPDYWDTVNEVGIPFYSMAEPLPMGKGWDFESQSNPLHVCTKPRACIRLVMDAT